MKKGFLIIAIGSNIFGRLVYNLANSIRLTKTTLPIQLLYTKSAITNLTSNDLKLFDFLTEIDIDFYKRNNILQYGYVKCNLDLFTLFEETIYIDADSFVLHNSNFDNYHLKNSFNITLNNKQTSFFIIESNSSFTWINNIELMNFINGFDIKNNKFYDINSSFFSFKKNDITKNLFNSFRNIFEYLEKPHQFTNNGITSSYFKFNTSWISNCVPDELVFSLGFLLNNYNPNIENICAFDYDYTNIDFFLKYHSVISFPSAGDNLSSNSNKLYNEYIDYMASYKRIKIFKWINKRQYYLNDIFLNCKT